MTSAPLWDIDVRKQLRHGSQRFSLDMTCRSDARRLVLFGPSGAGKSQTLRMIAGLVRPDEGRIVVGGETLFDSAATRRVDLSPQQRSLAFVFQDYALFPHLTVQQNVAFATRRGWLNPGARSPRGKSAANAKVDRWIAAFDLDAVRHLHPQQLSGGQRQRTALARALVGEPRALLLDEPFAALDKALRQRLREELSELQATLDIPLLLITHDEDDVRALGDDVLHLENGRATRLEKVAGDSNVRRD